MEVTSMFYSQLPTEGKILVYRLDGPPIELDRDKVVFTDRTRGIVRDRCQRKGYIEFEVFGTGLQTTGWNEHIAIGSTVHRGLEGLTLGDDLTPSINAAQRFFAESRPEFDWLPPELDKVLYDDALYLSTALVYAFDRRVLGHVHNVFDVLEAETEINWLMGELEDGRYLVMMSRPDGVWREKATGELWHVSFKTIGKIYDNFFDKLLIDQQKWSEGYAIQAKYGEQVAGTLYYYLVKGSQYEDSTLKVTRWTSGLIRPWLNTMAHLGGVPEPENLWYQYEWYDLDESKNKRLGKGWQRVDIYNEMPFEDYLDYLDRQIVGPNAPFGRDFLQEAVMGPSAFDGTDEMAVPWDEERASRWLRAKVFEEPTWLGKVEFIAGNIDKLHFDREFKVMDAEQCFSYRAKCSHFSFCHGGKSLEQLIEEGRLEPRKANHAQEMEE